MSNTSITYLIGAVTGVACVTVWAWLILVPAWAAMSRWWERAVSVLLSLYVLTALVAAGGGIAAALLWYYDEL
jgi:hypothetical protein